jgi:hypothetical protein
MRNKDCSTKFLFAMIIIVALDFSGCTSKPEPVPIPEPKPVPEPVYDEIIVVKDIGKYAILQIPANKNYTVKYIDSDVLTIKVIRDLDFNGNPPEASLAENIENNMSCASYRKGRTFTLATYGEFEAEDGSGSIELLIEVPLGLVVEQKRKLHGPESRAMKTDPDESAAYQPSFELAKGWTALSSTSLEGEDWTF